MAVDVDDAFYTSDERDDDRLVGGVTDISDQADDSVVEETFDMSVIGHGEGVVEKHFDLARMIFETTVARG